MERKKRIMLAMLTVVPWVVLCISPLFRAPADHLIGTPEVWLHAALLYPGLSELILAGEILLLVPLFLYDQFQLLLLSAQFFGPKLLCSSNPIAEKWLFSMMRSLAWAAFVALTIACLQFPFVAPSVVSAIGLMLMWCHPCPIYHRLFEPQPRLRVLGCGSAHFAGTYPRGDRRQGTGTDGGSTMAASAILAIPSRTAPVAHLESTSLMLFNRAEKNL